MFLDSPISAELLFSVLWKFATLSYSSQWDVVYVFQLRTEYLSLIYSVIKYSGYYDHHHRQQELEKCFIRIYKEEDVDNEGDRYIIKSIWMDFPQLFSGPE